LSTPRSSLEMKLSTRPCSRSHPSRKYIPTSRKTSAKWLAHCCPFLDLAAESRTSKALFAKPEFLHTLLTPSFSDGMALH
jgi:methylphosphotriester-DNA--protein-cysteine methyltransferase